MDDRTPDLTAGPHGQMVETARRHVAAYRDAMARQHEQALGLLTQMPADFSAAATACHRALQFQRQMNALEQLAGDTGLW